MSKQRRSAIVQSVIEANRYIAEFEERFRYMNQFLMKTGPKIAPDEFGYVPKKGEQIAIGYRINPSTLIAEHAAWLVDNELKLLGTTICEPVNGHGYFGIVVEKAFYLKHGSQSYNMILGNLRLIQTMGFKNYYA